VFSNKVLRRIVGTKRDEITGEGRKLHNEKLNDLYSPPNVILVIKLRRMRWVGHVACTGERRSVYRVLVGKETIWKTKHRLEYNIKVDLQEVGWGACIGVIWFQIGTDG